MLLSLRFFSHALNSPKVQVCTEAKLLGGVSVFVNGKAETCSERIAFSKIFPPPAKLSKRKFEARR
jgi:hypothetical protein